MCLKVLIFDCNPAIVSTHTHISLMSCSMCYQNWNQLRLITSYIVFLDVIWSFATFNLLIHSFSSLHRIASLFLTGCESLCSHTNYHLSYVNFSFVRALGDFVCVMVAHFQTITHRPVF